MGTTEWSRSLGPGGQPSELGIKVVLAEFAAAAEHHGIFAKITEFTDIAGPGIGFERSNCAGLECQRRGALFPWEKI